MDAAEKAIDEIRAVRHRISAKHGHDVYKYVVELRAEEKQHPAQLKRGKKLLPRRDGSERPGFRYKRILE
jgi:hypothetical protein